MLRASSKQKFPDSAAACTPAGAHTTTESGSHRKYEAHQSSCLSLTLLNYIFSHFIQVRLQDAAINVCFIKQKSNAFSRSSS